MNPNICTNLNISTISLINHANNDEFMANKILEILTDPCFSQHHVNQLNELIPNDFFVRLETGLSYKILDVLFNKEEFCHLHIETLKLFLGQGLDLGRFEIAGYEIPLCIPVSQDFINEYHAELISMLINLGVDINIAGNTNLVLSLPIDKNYFNKYHLQILQALINEGLQVNEYFFGARIPIEKDFLNEHHLEALKILVNSGLYISNESIASKYFLTKITQVIKFSEKHLKAINFLLFNGLDFVNGKTLHDLKFYEVIKSLPKSVTCGFHKNLISLIRNNEQFNLSEYKTRMYLKSIGHAFNLSGPDFESGRDFYWLKKMNKALNIINVQDRFKDLLPKDSLEQLSHAVKFGVVNEEKQDVEVLAQIKCGKPVIISDAGFIGHSVSYLAWADTSGIVHLALCNLGAASRQQVEVFAINSEELDENIIAEIRSSKKDYKQYSEWLDGFFHNTKFSKDALCNNLEKRSKTLSMQVTGNCSYISNLTTLWALLAMHEYRKCLKVNPQKVNIFQMNKIYVDLSIFFQAYHLERALGIYKIRLKDLSTLEKCKKAKIPKVTLISPSHIQLINYVRNRLNDRSQFITCAALKSSIKGLSDSVSQAETDINQQYYEAMSNDLKGMRVNGSRPRLSPLPLLVKR